MSMTADELVENFDLFDEWEDRYAYLIDLGKKLPLMDEADKTAENKISGCLSQVWIIWHKDNDNPNNLRFIADSDAFIVKGVIAVLMVLFDNKNPSQIVQTDADAVMAEIGLDKQLSPNRRNGLASMVARIKSIAQAELA